MAGPIKRRRAHWKARGFLGTLDGWKRQNIVSIKVNGREIKPDGRYSIAGCERSGEAIDVVCRQHGLPSHFNALAGGCLLASLPSGSLYRRASTPRGTLQCRQMLFGG